MPRSKKATVDYFPHSCNHGKTIHIIESKFGNDGYAFWFKLLELLGSTENHFIDCNDPATWEYLLAKTRLNGETATFILNLLAALDSITEKFWKMKVIWSENFAKNLEAVYERRRINVFTTDDIEAYCQQIRHLSGKDVNINPQSKVKESKVKESKGKYSVCFLKFYQAYPNKTAKEKAFESFKKINPDDELLEKMLSAIAWQREMKGWKKDNGEFVPMPSTWLNQKRWEDERPAAEFKVGMNPPGPQLSEAEYTRRDIEDTKLRLEAYKRQRADRELTDLEKKTIEIMKKNIREAEYGK